MSRTPIRIVLGDDHAVVRAGFRRLLEQQEDVHVVAEAADGDRTYDLAVEHNPTVVVMDLSMPGAGGLETIQRILSRLPQARILVFSMHEDASLAERAVKLGARGYVTKSSAPEALAAAVTDIAAGKLFLSSDIARSMAFLKLAGDDNPTNLLSARELEIFRLIVAGRRTGEIAALLNLSGKTIANYHTGIKRKLAIDSDVELVLLAGRHKLL